MKEQHECRSGSLAKKRSRLSVASKPSLVALIKELSPSDFTPFQNPVFVEIAHRTQGISFSIRHHSIQEWSGSDDRCNTCVDSGGSCGYNSSDKGFTCFCKDGPTALTCLSTGSSPKSNLRKKVYIGSFSAGLIGLIVVFIALICWIRRKPPLLLKAIIYRGKDEKNNHKLEEFIKTFASPLPRRYSYSDIKKMTKSLMEKLGEGGYGSVYKGKLSDGSLVAVKVLSKSKGDGEDFINEVASISTTSHINVVSLIGFCLEETRKALIYEFMPNGSLDKLIYNGRLLAWEKMFQIAIGIARGLEYLHRGCNTRIVHFDIKPQNILLDEDWCPKISDFGLAKLCNRKQSIMSMKDVRGTAGYMAPELFSRNFGGASHKSDVYSFGMMVFEMVGGRKNFNVNVSKTSEVYFPIWVYKRLEVGEAFNIGDDLNEDQEELAKKMILVSFWCIQTNPMDRPSMSKVVDILQGSLQSIEIPPNPILCSPTRSP